jgi:hypothetical protein
MTTYSYDKKTEELAEHFLEDVSMDNPVQRVLLIRELAQVLQDAMELWFEGKMKP